MYFIFDVEINLINSTIVVMTVIIAAAIVMAITLIITIVIIIIEFLKKLQSTFLHFFILEYFNFSSILIDFAQI